MKAFEGKYPFNCNSLNLQNQNPQNNSLIYTPVVQEAILRAFHECFNIAGFLFDLTTASVEDWVTLYSPAMRCAVEKCGSGFIFVTWLDQPGQFV